MATSPERLLALHAEWPHRYPALLESAARGEQLGRYDLLFAHPTGCLAKFSDGRLSATGCARRVQLPASGSFLEALERFFAADRATVHPGLPFSGGWLVFAGYEIAGEIEPRLHRALGRGTDEGTGTGTDIDAFALRIPAALIYDHDRERLHLVAETGHGALLDQIEHDLQACPPQESVPGFGADSFAISEDDPQRYLGAVQRAQEFIRAGDVYQVNLSRGWHARAQGTMRLGDVYASLRAANPAPFAASVVLGAHAILSSSPERLFSVRDGQVTTRPIAGTRPRTRRPGADDAERSSLAAHPKERAEHVMLIDLERNDLGRICTPGSVRVDEFMALESYEHVHHIVSNVRGTLRAGTTPADVLRAVFPGGTITGCPKIRCMEIISELEGVARGAYTGTLGYLNRDGSGDFNILIRTMTCSPAGIALRAGAGIVADSIPERELEETRAKARGMLRALGQDL